MPFTTNITNAVAPGMKVFHACFVALIVISFGFMLHAIILPERGNLFDLTQTRLGEIAGVGLYSFAISIVLCSLIINEIVLLILYFKSNGAYKAVDLKGKYVRITFAKTV
jgi:hypothetical protein